MDAFICNSPFRRLYKHAWMPTCDALPQKTEWLSQFKDADAVFTYTDWSKEVLENSGIEVRGSCPPTCSAELKPGHSTKEQLGLGQDIKIVGTVMRNQRRKLYSDLFQGFRTFLNNTKRTDVILLCHTSYPDRGWYIPELLLENGICSKVLFSYICRNCNNFQISHWADAMTQCYKCHNLSCGLPSVKNGLDMQQFAALFNCMDVYVQYANSEGFGIPLIEAAACGVPVMSVDYSAPQDIIKKLQGTPIPVQALNRELETGCYRSIPNNDEFAKLIEKELNSDLVSKGIIARSMFEQNYSMEHTGKNWMDYFDTVTPSDWTIGANIKQIPNGETCPPNLSNNEFARWLILYVLAQPDRVGSYFEARINKDLNYGQTFGGLMGMYMNENSLLFSDGEMELFDRQRAFHECAAIRQNINQWEQRRVSL